MRKYSHRLLHELKAMLQVLTNTDSLKVAQNNSF